jgi:hypothetical protein
MDIRGWYRGLTAKQRDMVSLAGEGTLLVLLLAISTYAWNQRHITVKTNTVTVTKNVLVSPSPSASATPAPVDSEMVTVPIDSVSPGYRLSLQVPTAWRAVDVRSQVALADYPGYAQADLAALLRFVPEHAERNHSAPAVEAGSRLDVLVGQALRCVPAGAVCSGDQLKPVAVKSAEGWVTGQAYLYLPPGAYEPAVVVDMTGSVAGKPVRVSGYFRIYDEAYADPTKAAAARMAFIGGNPPADTLAMYDRVVAAVNSMRFMGRP